MCRSVSLILSVILVAVPAGVLGQGGLLSQVRAAGTLRICADPDNLPFSGDEPAEPGFDVELAGQIAKRLGVREEVRWEPTFLGPRAIRQLLEGRCDVFMGLPHDPRFVDANPRLALSTPYYTLRHVLVSRAAKPTPDLGRVGATKVAVERGSMADLHLFREGHNRYIYRTQTDAFQGFVRGEAEVALLWEPVARWLMKRQTGPPLEASVVSGPDLEFRVAIGIRRGEAEFQAAVDDVVRRLLAAGEVDGILGRYGMPASSVRPAAAAMLAPADSTPIDPTKKLGRSLYFQMCAPCHGPDAAGGGPIDALKRFRGTPLEFVQTTLDGRIAKGMPPFRGQVSEDEAQAIRGFVLSLPK